MVSDLDRRAAAEAVHRVSRCAEMLSDLACPDGVLNGSHGAPQQKTPASKISIRLYIVQLDTGRYKSVLRLLQADAKPRAVRGNPRDMDFAARMNFSSADRRTMPRPDSSPT